jgi:hypothetical protein
MAILQRTMIAFLTVAVLATGVVRAASTTNFSDYWYVANQSGWGMSVQQQSDVLFVALYVYGTDSKPTWLTATAFYQSNSVTGHIVFTGDLYLTNGTYYGATWNPAALGYTRVGTLTFDATTTNDATLTYTVDGTPVVKNVTRQLWRYENLTGKYGGSWHLECSSGPPYNEWFTLTVTHNADNSVVMLQEELFGYFLFRGTYSQNGHMGQIVAQLQAPDAGTVTFSEIERTPSGLVGRVSGTLNGCQLVSGRFAAVLQ